MSSLQLGVQLFHAIDEESCLEVVHTSLREGGVSTTLGAREWFVEASSQGKPVDALFAVVMETRQDLGISVVILTHGTSDLLL